jgi:hypothetical protein
MIQGNESQIVRTLPKPKGTILLFLFWIGAIGAFICAIDLCYVGFTVHDNSSIPSDFPFIYFALGLMILSVGCFGVYWNYGCLWGLLGTISLPITSVILIIILYIQPHADMAILIISMILLHLSFSHMRAHLPEGHISHTLIFINRFLNYGAIGAIIYTIFTSLATIFFYTMFILMLDMVFLLLIPKPGPWIENKPEPKLLYLSPYYYPPLQ